MSNVEIPLEDIEDLKNSYEFHFKLNELEFNNDLFIEGLKLSDQIKSDLLNNNFFNASTRDQSKDLKQLFQKDDSNREAISMLIRNSKSENIRSYNTLRKLIEARNNQSDHYFKIQKALDSDKKLKLNKEDYNIKYLQKKLSEDSTTILNYFFNDSDLYISLVSPFKNYSLRLNSDSINLDSIIFGFVNAISTNPLTPNENLSSGLWEKKASELYNILVLPFVNDIYGNLLIIPDGGLNYLPFSTLVEEMPNNIENYKQYKFLAKRYCIFYSHSIESFLYQSSKGKEKKELKFLGVAPTFSNVIKVAEIRSDLGVLNYNVAEIEEIEKIVGGVILVGPETELLKVNGHVTNASIMHMATHTLMPNGEYENIEIVLNDIEEDKYSRALVSEILKKKKSPSLVVLSACNSALGEHIQGEGLVSLTNGFFKKGAKSVISTLWEANDFSMKEIFVDFYKYIDLEFPISQSLQMAQLEYLKNSSNEILHPYFWSGINTYGAGNLIFEKKSILARYRKFLFFSLTLIVVAWLSFKFLNIYPVR